MSATQTVRQRSRVSGCESCKARKQRISGHLTRFRTRSRITASQQAGEVRIESVDIDPGEVSPLGSIEVTLNLRETAEFVGTGPELCAPGGIAGSGIAVIATVDPDWTADQDTEVCIPVLNFGSGRVSPTFRFQAPDLPSGVTEETHTFTITIQIRGHPNRTATVTRSINVAQEAPSEPADGGTNGDGGTGPLLPCFLDPNQQCSPFEQFAWAGSVFFIIFLLAAGR